MGNFNTALLHQGVIETNVSSNSSLTVPGALAHFPVSHDFFWPFPFSAAVYAEIMNQCDMETGETFRLGFKIFILLMSFPANTGLMWMLMNRKTAMTSSQVLGLNVSIMDVLYCLCLPLDIYSSLHYISETTRSVQGALFALNIFGCPLLLTFMCLERCIAVVRPVDYVRLGRLEYRTFLCVCAWMLTLAIGVLTYFVGMFRMVLPVSVTISLLFTVMLLCLLGIVRVLMQSGPGEGSEMSTPLKRRALRNVLAVMAPSVVAYTPLMAVVPYMTVIKLQNFTNTISHTQCDVLYFMFMFPNFGLFIGPMFYISRLRNFTRWNPKSRMLVQ